MANILKKPEGSKDYFFFREQPFSLEPTTKSQVVRVHVYVWQLNIVEFLRLLNESPRTTTIVAEPVVVVVEVVLTVK